MQKRSHSLLAHKLLDAQSGFSARRYEWVFLLGSVSPDCNPLTYLKGSLHAMPLHGHNYDNAKHFIMGHIQRLQRCNHWGLWQYYTLGKLTHYLADAFIFPHNNHYPDTILEHRRYENSFRLFLKAYLEDTPLHQMAPCTDAVQAIESLHKQYMESLSTMHRDATYILQATGLLVSSCLMGL